ncbi:hypothetical protein N499_0529A, partial [Wolbachia pipientis wVitA]
MATDKI